MTCGPHPSAKGKGGRRLLLGSAELATASWAGPHRRERGEELGPCRGPGARVERQADGPSATR